MPEVGRTNPSAPPRRSLRLLVTAGPTQEPIDSVRYIGNRSSGRLGMAVAAEGAARGHHVTLLLGPVGSRTGTEETTGENDRLTQGPGTREKTLRFRTASELGALLAEHAPHSDVLIMAAAVADYRPKHADLEAKIKRTSAALTLELEPTPDLLAEVASRRRPGQLLVGFALEPRERLLASAREKLERKGIDLIVANELSTMESPDIEARVLGRRGEDFSTGGPVAKARFAAWLLDIVERSALSA